jgi:hypothetical protein
MRSVVILMHPPHLSVYLSWKPSGTEKVYLVKNVCHFSANLFQTVV